jgi:hypothetical protein
MNESFEITPNANMQSQFSAENSALCNYDNIEYLIGLYSLENLSSKEDEFEAIAKTSSVYENICDDKPVKIMIVIINSGIPTQKREIFILT